MKLKPRHFIILGVAAALLVVAYLAWEVLTPFILAAIFAYLLDPAVTFLSERVRLPRPLAIVSVYLGLIAFLAVSSVLVGGQLVEETKNFAHEARLLLGEIETGQSELPSWAAPYIVNLSSQLRGSINFSSQQAVRFFSGALSSVVAIFVFLLALFYFLKEGRDLSRNWEKLLPSVSRTEVAIVIAKVNQVLKNYLLAQFSLVILMSLVTFGVFAALGVRYALVLAVVVGLAELVPIIGPTFAFLSVVFATTIGGGASQLNVPFIYQPLIIGLVYVLLNQLENILVVPNVTGKMVRLHPLVILASIIIGGHLFGMIGFLVAVPLVASAKVILDHVLDLLE